MHDVWCGHLASIDRTVPPLTSHAFLSRKGGREILVLATVDLAAVHLRPDAAPLLVMEGDAVRGALVAERADPRRIRKAVLRPTLAARNDPVRPSIANVDRAEQRFGRDAMPCG